MLINCKCFVNHETHKTAKYKEKFHEKAKEARNLQKRLQNATKTPSSKKLQKNFNEMSKSGKRKRLTSIVEGLEETLTDQTPAAKTSFLTQIMDK